MGMEISPFDKKWCGECGHLFSAVTWWCGCDEAADFRGTKIPGVINCPFWKPNWKYIPKEYKTLENGYKSTLIDRLLNIFKLKP